jgi:RNA polymerase sigma-70 factor (ECF subfamily)
VPHDYYDYNRVNYFPGGNVEQERAWIEKIAQGNFNAYENLCKVYQNRLFVYLFRILNSRETAEEVANDVMLAVWKGANNFRGDSLPSTWIFGIARNRAYSRLSRRRLDFGDGEEPESLVDKQDGMEETLIRKNLIRHALKELSSEHREVVTLTFFSGLSYQEIAEIMNCPVNTVKTRMFHAKQRLRAILEQ